MSTKHRLVMMGDKTPVLPFYEDNLDAIYITTGGTPVTYTVPAGVVALKFACTVDFYARKNAAVSVPAANVTDGSAPMLNPVFVQVQGGDTISLDTGTGNDGIPIFIERFTG